jgi:23S rRNA (uracil1939-C5)-methyltransferase
MTEAVRTRRRKAPKPPIELDLQLQDWAGRGSTYAELDGRCILVDRGIPGERVIAAVDRRRSPWRGTVEQVVEASPDRVSPPCPYYLRNCGGCQLQHLAYEAQLGAKRELVDRELRANGLQARIQNVYAMADPWRYRRTAAVALGWEAGFRPRGRRGIVEIHDCLISHPLIGRLTARLNELLRAGRLPNYHGKVWLDCTVVGYDAEPFLQTLLQGISGLTLDTHPELPEVAATLATIGGVRSVAYRHRSGEPRELVGDLMSTIEVDGRLMYLPAGSFFQTNLEMLAVLLDRMRSALGGRSIGSAADVYGGVGTFALALAEQVERMTLVELDDLAVAAACRTAAERGLDNLIFVNRHAEWALADLVALDLVVIDPPRSGLGEVVVDAILSKAPPLVFYVSCSPPSFARDLRRLQSGGYSVETLEIFDFYPQTYHVESLAILER